MLPETLKLIVALVIEVVNYWLKGFRPSWTKRVKGFI